MELSSDFSGSLRRHQDSPNFWLAVLAGSLAVHLVFLLSGQWLLVRVAPVRSGGSSTPIELVDLPQKSSSQPTQSASSTPPKVTSVPPADSGATSPIQPPEPTQPTIVPTPKPIQERRPLDNSERSPTQIPSAPRQPATPTPSIPSEPPASSENTDPPNSPQQPSDGENNSPTPQPSNSGQPNPPQSSGDQNNPPNPQPSNGTQTDPRLPPPGIPGPIGSEQNLPPTEVTIAAQVAGQIRRADPTRNDSQAKTAQLRGNEQQQITIPYSPDFKLLPGQILNLEVRFVVDTTNGKVINATVPVNSTSMSDAGLDRLVTQVFEPLLFDVTFDTAAVNKAPLTDWIVPVQIQVVK
ncbi:hypothetical protein [Phormidesmis priestleyi]